MNDRRRSLLSWICGVLAFALAGSALADPPIRVARLSYASGVVSFASGSEPDAWVRAPINRPVITGDQLWTDRNARAELELGTTVLRLAPFTSMTVLDIGDRITQVKLAQGAMYVRVRSLLRGETVEIDTPNLAFAVVTPGTYRIEVDDRGDATVVAVRQGRGEVYGDRVSYLVDSGQWYRFSGTDLQNDYARIPVADSFERWAESRDQRYDRRRYARYVSPEMIGWEDLAQYGTWRAVPEYGNVWIPRTVPADWAPYRDGRWAWIDPWGWTWVDDAPWGFAPFHYGRWARVSNDWAWVPGPVNVRPVYAPALVAFVGGAGFDLSLTAGGGRERGVAWFPLAPGEVYQPAYRVSETYFRQVNVTNTRVNVNVVNNYYNNQESPRDIRYSNRMAPGAITAVPIATFVESRQVARAAIPLMRDVANAAPVTAMPVIAPVRSSVVGGATPAPNRPPARVEGRQTVARTQPPAAPPAFISAQPAAAGGGLGAGSNRATTSVARPAPLHENVRVVSPGPPTRAATTEQRAPAVAAPNGGGGGLGGAPAPQRAGSPSAPPAPAAGGRPGASASPGAGPNQGRGNGTVAAPAVRGEARAPGSAAPPATVPSAGVRPPGAPAGGGLGTPAPARNAERVKEGPAAGRNGTGIQGPEAKGSPANVQQRPGPGPQSRVGGREGALPTPPPAAANHPGAAAPPPPATPAPPSAIRPAERIATPVPTPAVRPAPERLAPRVAPPSPPPPAEHAAAPRAIPPAVHPQVVAPAAPVAAPPRPAPPREKPAEKAVNPDHAKGGGNPAAPKGGEPGKEKSKEGNAKDKNEKDKNP